ncbi:MAG: hypothetical protein EPN97_14375 [Alphaproteobacteria bacterium]|nr:MAG: hypothetical protein EPN97_14375 [Alphaproteobacteria bacterium]
MSEAPKEYEHIEFDFSRPPPRRNGKSYEIKAYLLVPADVMPELKSWLDAKAEGKKEGLPSGLEMFQTLKEKGALLHREDGPAYKEVEKSAFDRSHSVVTQEQYWEKGVQKPSGAPRVRPVGGFRR